FITRIPGTLKLVSQVIRQALKWDMWQRLDDTTRYCGLELCHYGMAQRWLVVSSQAALERAAQFLAVCRRLKMGAMGTRWPGRGSHLCRRCALPRQGEMLRLRQIVCATKYEKLREGRKSPAAIMAWLTALHPALQ